MMGKTTSAWPWRECSDSPGPEARDSLTGDEYMAELLETSAEQCGVAIIVGETVPDLIARLRTAAIAFGGWASGFAEVVTPFGCVPIRFDRTIRMPHGCHARAMIVWADSGSAEDTDDRTPPEQIPDEPERGRRVPGPDLMRRLKRGRR